MNMVILLCLGVVESWSLGVAPPTFGDSGGAVRLYLQGATGLYLARKRKVSATRKY